MPKQYKSFCFTPQKIEQIFNLLIIWVSEREKVEVFFDIMDGQQIECCCKSDESKQSEHDSAYESADDSEDDSNDDSDADFSKMKLYLKEDGKILFTKQNYPEEQLVNINSFNDSKVFIRTF
jgi:hypothetical protein